MAVNFKYDIQILRNCFTLVGIPFHEIQDDTSYGINNCIMRSIASFLLTYFHLFGLVCFLTGPVVYSKDIFLMITVIAEAVTVFLLRSTFLYQRRNIEVLLTDLQDILGNCKRKSLQCICIPIYKNCILNIAIPLTTTSIILHIMFLNIDEVMNDPNDPFTYLFHDDQFSYKMVMIIYSFSYAFYFFVLPSLCTTLLCYVYSLFEAAVLDTVEKIHKDLVYKQNEERISNSSFLIFKISKIHEKVENIFSFSTFLVYVLVFINFLNLVSVNYSDFSNTIVTAQIISTVTIFMCTTFWFGRLTFTGSTLIKICDDWKFMKQDIIKQSLRRNRKQPYLKLLLFLKSAKLKLCFTGWDMFAVDKSLLLNMAGIIISYSILLITI